MMLRRFLSSQKDNILAPGLWVVAVPIGNLSDISPRARHALEFSSIILCEDTRNTAHLLHLLQIEHYMPRLNRFDAHSRDAERWINQIKLGKSICLVSDAGTPGISDPGALLVRHAAQCGGIRLTPVPGPSAVTTLLSVCGFDGSYSFRGFYPRKLKDQEREVKTLNSRGGVSDIFVYFESPLRIEMTLTQLVPLLPCSASLVVAKELTKLHETLFFGKNPQEVLIKVQEVLKGPQTLGEWCFAIHLKNETTESEAGENDDEEKEQVWGATLKCLFDAKVPLSEAVKIVSSRFSAPKKTVYKTALRFKAEMEK